MKNKPVIVKAFDWVNGRLEYSQHVFNNMHEANIYMQLNNHQIIKTYDQNRRLIDQKISRIRKHDTYA